MTPHFETLSVPVLKIQEQPKPLWRMLGTLRFWSEVVNDWVEATEGFVTDGCSIPREPLIYLFVGGRANEAGYIHDQLYTTQKYDRETCDRILREMVIAMGYPVEMADAFYLGVRIGGESHWNLPNVPQTPEVNALLSGA